MSGPRAWTSRNPSPPPPRRPKSSEKRSERSSSPAGTGAAEALEAGSAVVAAALLLPGIITVVLALRPFLPQRVDLARIEPPPFLGVAQQVIGRRHRLKLGLLARIVGVQIGVQRFRKPSVGLLDLVLRGVLRHAENLVGIVFQIGHD